MSHEHPTKPNEITSDGNEVQSASSMKKTKNNDSKWKNSLLRSSLPLEQLVNEKLEKLDIYIAGEYPYIRPNEHNIETEFSIDLHAFDLIEYSHQQNVGWSMLHFLIECKYNYPGVKWIFLPIPDDSLKVMNSIRCLEELSNKRLANKEPIYTIDDQLRFCAKGIELHPNGDIDMNSILRGLSQLRYGLPNMIAHLISAQINTHHEEDLHIEFVCPILVTTANLYILKKGLDLDAYFSATTLDDVAEEIDTLITFQENGPHLFQYCRNIFQTLNNQYPEIQATLLNIESIHQSGKMLIKNLESEIEEEYSPVIVTRLESLERVIEIIRTSIKDAEKYLEKIAEFRHDYDPLSQHFFPLKQTKHKSSPSAKRAFSRTQNPLT